ncbi:MAG: hypothetical protein R3F19_11060 [Verrucomicrobiales bacterium]
MNNRRIRKLPQRDGKRPDADAMAGESLDFVDLASRHRIEQDRREREALAREERLQALLAAKRTAAVEKEATAQEVNPEVTGDDADGIAEAEAVELFEADQRDRRVFSTALQHEVSIRNTRQIQWFERGSRLAGIGVVVLAVILAIAYAARTNSNGPTLDGDNPATGPNEPSLDNARRMASAKAIARKFVRATSMSERLSCVRFPGKVAKLMAKDRTMNWDAPLPVGEVLEYGEYDFENPPFFLGCYVEDDLEKAYDIRLMAVDSIDDLITEGRNLIVVARVGDGIHIRIFGADGGEFFDRTELELESGLSLLMLKDAVSPGAPLENLSAEEKNTLIRSALSTSGYDRVKRYPIEVEIRSDGSLIDWEAFAEYNEVPWQEVLKERSPMRDYTMRVVAMGFDYYNYQFTEDKYTCFQIQNRSQTQAIYAYARKGGWVEKEIRNFMSNKIAREGVGSAIMSFIQVKIRFPEKPTPEPMAEIVAYLAPHWYTLAPEVDERSMVTPDAILGAGSESDKASKRAPDSDAPMAPKGSWR